MELNATGFNADDVVGKLNAQELGITRRIQVDNENGAQNEVTVVAIKTNIENQCTFFRIWCMSIVQHGMTCHHHLRDWK